MPTGGGWGAAGGGHQPVDDWGITAKATPKGHAPSVANTSSWGGWGPAPQHQHQHQQHTHNGLANAKIPKVTVQAPSSADAKTVVSAKQHSGGGGLLSAILGFGRGKNQQGGTTQKEKGQTPKDKHKSNRKDDKKAAEAAKYSPWIRVGPDIEEEDEEEDEEEEEEATPA